MANGQMHPVGTVVGQTFEKQKKQVLRGVIGAQRANWENGQRNKLIRRGELFMIPCSPLDQAASTPPAPRQTVPSTGIQNYNFPMTRSG